MEKGIIDVKLETDSLTAVRLLNGDIDIQHQHAALVEDSKMLMSRTGTTITHVYRMANQSTDNLARLGADQQDEELLTGACTPFPFWNHIIQTNNPQNFTEQSVLCPSTNNSSKGDCLSEIVRDRLPPSQSTDRHHHRRPADRDCPNTTPDSRAAICLQNSLITKII
ncbi:hypothetical protein RHGRI_007149 [Rhododendron griersonianum]|uniref:RNase H type-1 domain-containing protein n=1 Tax=Rhododendron griersonianum TaxID=479676 RepID=A0AAV6KW10_9ERIC|nr:hypothetical protein RHGRI_007149 [Rhododendron griersonianum]